LRRVVSLRRILSLSRIVLLLWLVDDGYGGVSCVKDRCLTIWVDNWGDRRKLVATGVPFGLYVHSPC